VDAVQIKTIEKGSDVIKQGDQGDFFYIVKAGLFDILINSKDGGAPKKVVFSIFLSDIQSVFKNFW